MNSVDKAYNQLAQWVLNTGYTRPSRVGDTISLPGTQLVLPNVCDEFPIITTRKVFIKGIIGELAAFLQGATKLQDFKSFGCNYWDKNAGEWTPNKNKPETEWEVGRVYGAQWRSWGPLGMDQLAVLISGLMNDKYGRRHILTTWNPGELTKMCLPPCHLLAQFYAREEHLDCIVYMRSVDIALGLPSDMVLYGALLMLVAKDVGLKAGSLTFQFGDAHIYAAHVEALTKQLQLVSPTREITGELAENTSSFDFDPSQFSLNNYNPLEPIQYELF
jgi:thymidylate synthase